MKAVISIIGEITDKYSNELRKDINYPNLVWPQINEMIEDGVAEIQNHSYNMHSKYGSGKLKREGAEAYKARFKSDLEKMQARVKEMTGLSPTIFTYPFGKISKESYPVLKELGFLGSLSCYEGLNILQQGKPDSLFLLKRYIRKSDRPVMKILKIAK